MEEKWFLAVRNLVSGRWDKEPVPVSHLPVSHPAKKMAREICDREGLTNLKRLQYSKNDR